MSLSNALNIAVIGGTRGIGLELCHHFASTGHNVALCARSDGADNVARELQREYKVKSYGLSIDAADEQSCIDFSTESQKVIGPVDVLFANAAMFGPVGKIDTIDITRWSEVLTSNTLTLVNPIRAFLPSLRKSTNARILTMSGGGLGGSRPIQRATAYVASKSATVTLVEALAIELLEENITVNAIAPGFFPTSFMSEAKNVGPEVAGNDLYSDATQTADESTEESLAQLFTVVDFLMSPEASVISGRIISARWDTQEAVLDLSKSSNAFRLRRVDEILIKDAK